MGGTLVVMGTAFLTWCSDNVSGQNDLLMVFLAGILMLTFLFCIPLAIMNYLSKDYFFTAAVSVLAFFMARAHFTVMDTLGTGNIQMQACLVFLGVKVVFSLFPLILFILETTVFILFHKYDKELITLSGYIDYGKHTTLVILSLYFIWVIIP